MAAVKASEDTGKGASESDKATAAGWAFFFRNPAVVWVYVFGYLLALGPGAQASFPANGNQGTASAAAGSHEVGWQLSWRLHLGYASLPNMARDP